MTDLNEYEFEREIAGLGNCTRLLGGGMAASRPFPLTGDTAHYARDLVVDVKHIKLEIAIDPKRKHVGGTATHTVSAINDNVRRIDFDAVEMEISGVTAGGKPVKFDYS